MAGTIDPFLANTHIGYFTMEIALRNEIHTYSGGLGVLAGDTARSCADLQIPVVFVSLASRKGYLRQEIDAHGCQVDHPDPWNPGEWASPLNAMVAITMEGRSVWIRPWLHVLTCPLGNAVPIILLDTDLEENSPADRDITDDLYGDGEIYRLRQEAVLGIGGVRVLQALGFEIHTYHLNEGHAALLAIELLRRHRRALGAVETSGAIYDRERVLQSCIFTTHTQVEAAHDQFPYEIVKRVLGDFIELEELQRYAGADACNMTQLALNLSGYVNGVARRHAETTSRTYPRYHVKAITNGVHTARWAHAAFARLFDKHFAHWSHEPEALMRADQMDDAETWNAHGEAKRDLIALVKERTGVRLDPDVALIGFARRMTGYKRPELLFADIERLKAICGRQRFQVVWAGKAHPQDLEGKRLIEQLNGHVRELEGKISISQRGWSQAVTFGSTRLFRPSKPPGPAE
jgi:starch phosphorylase